MTSILNSAVLSPVGNCAIKAKTKARVPPDKNTAKSPKDWHKIPLQGRS